VEQPNSSAALATLLSTKIRAELIKNPPQDTAFGGPPARMACGRL
jgi:hypothetical protein